MARIDFAWEMGGQTGHVATMLPIARALKARGHAVRLFLKHVSAGSDFDGAGEIPREGAPNWVGPAVYPKPLNFGEILHNFGYHDASALRQLVDAWRERLRGAQAIVANAAPAAHIAARTLGIESCEISPGFHVPPAAMPVPPLRDWEPAPRARLEEADRRVVGAINRVLAAFDASRISTLGELFDGRALLLNYPELDTYAHRGSAEYFGIPEVAGGSLLPAWPAARRPRVFAYVYNYYKGLAPLLDSLAKVQASTLMLCRDINPALKHKHGQGNVFLAGQAMSVAQLLPQCDVVVCHASHQMTAQALLAGKPVLLLPTQLEQHLLMRCVVRLGAGLGIGPDVAHADFAAALHELSSNPGYRTKAGEFASRYASQDWQATLAILIKRCEAALG